MAPPTRSLWTATAASTSFARLDRNIHTDVLVIGAGITGLLTALLLRRDGFDVTVIDKERVGTGATGHTTAKLSSLHQLVYAELSSRFGHEGARTYAEANEAGLARIAGLVEELSIDCQFRRRPNYTYAASADDRADVQEEAEAARRAGLAASYVDEIPFPVPTQGGATVADQAEFHPLRFLVDIAAALEGEGGRIFEHTLATRLHDGEPCQVETTGGRITAGHVVVATHYPFPDRALFFARLHGERSYCIAAPVSGPPSPGMFISASSPTRSIRFHPEGDRELLIVSGEGHKVGQGGPTTPRYAALEEFAREHFAIDDITHRWSTQDNFSADGAPLIGKLTPRSRRTWTATGFRKWGLAMAAASAEMITDGIAGRDNSRLAFFDANRFTPVASAVELVKENANVGFHFLADRITRRSADSAEGLRRGEGKVVSRRGRQVAVSRDQNGRLHTVSARCTHLGCILNWNDAEQSWDCPCHASRFAPDGSVLQGPAVNPLDSRDPPRDS
jgi:glycine/D-amino acid oxidase-like deaminating enzyme/nitrite reductase/ring-hydroxylating ferredoxin subunit